MADLSTSYLGLKLKNPLVVSASPLTERLENIKYIEECGGSAIVMHSLFEEQLTNETYELQHHLTHGTLSNPEALTYFPPSRDFSVGPEEYLRQIREAKKAVDIPIIGSLNGHSPGGWTEYAKKIEDAGADAIELNIYFVATDPNLSGEQVESRYLEILKGVKGSVKIPVAVKLSPYLSALANMANRLDQAGASGLVLFNRFYQPDIDLENLEVVTNVALSSPAQIRLPLRWMAILHGRIKASLAATTGVHSATDVLKLLMAGADVTMLCSVLIKRGIPHIGHVLSGIQTWMEEHEYESVSQMKGSMSQKSIEDPAAFERAHYMRAVSSTPRPDQF